MTTQNPGTSSSNSSSPSSTTSIAHIAAFEATRAERDALTEGDVIGVFTDVLVASTLIMGVVANTSEYEAEVTRLLGAGLRDRVAQLALAASHAQQLHLIAEPSAEDLAPLMEELKATRTLLLHDA